MASTRYILGTALGAAALAGALLFALQPAAPVPGPATETAAVEGAGPLDGMTFVSELGPQGKPADVRDTLIFAKGTFVSAECEKRCGYPARPYFARESDGKVEFISETRCPNKNAKIVWRGIIDDDRIQGSFTWTVERWYWTIEKEFWFQGTVLQAGAPIAHSR